MRKPTFCICKNKDADQLGSNCTADQGLCFRYMDSTIPLLPKSEISSLKPSSVAVQPGLCLNLFETPKTGFLMTQLNLHLLFYTLSFVYSVPGLPSMPPPPPAQAPPGLPPSAPTQGVPQMVNETCREKTCLRGFRPGPTQTKLYSHRRWLYIYRALKFQI